MDRPAFPAASRAAPRPVPPPERVLRVVTLCVARDFGLDPNDVLARLRGAPHEAFARQVAVYLAHVCFGLSFAAVGRMLYKRTGMGHALCNDQGPVAR